MPAKKSSLTTINDTQRRWITAVFAVIIAHIFVYGVSLWLLPQGDGTSSWNSINYVAIELAAALLVFARVALVTHERRAWAFMAVGLLCLSASGAIESIFGGPRGVQSNTNASQVLYVAFVVSIFLALGMIIRERVARASTSVWLDGVIAALGLLAAVSYFTITSGEPLVGGALIRLLFLAAPLLFVAVLIGVLTALDRKPGTVWWLMLSAAVLMAASNIAQANDIVGGDYTFGSPIDVLWPIATILIAIGAWYRQPERPRVESSPAGIVFAPAVFSLGALAVVIANEFGVGSDITEFFALGTLGVTIVRLLISVGEAEHLRQRENQLSINLKRARDEAIDADNAKSTFLATMSHEIRTPLNAMLGMTELLLDTELDESQKEYANRALLSGTLLSEIVTNILDFSKIEAGALTLENRRFDLARVVAGTVMVVSFAAESKTLTIVPDVADDCPRFVMGDSVRLRQILVNLLGNAVKFTTNGEIQLAVSRGEGDLIRFDVTDTGVGIAAAHMDRLFEPFTQADESTTRTYGGTGLGLTISKSLVTAMGGIMGAESELGTGSHFWFEIPLPEVSHDHESGLEHSNHDGVESATKKQSYEALAPLRVLIAEDNETLQLLSTRLVTKLGHSVDLVTTGVEAVNAAQRGDYDVVLMDVHMPYMDGLEATRRIRAMSTSIRQPRIVALTASATVRDRDACFAAGMDEYVSKPFTAQDLHRAFLAVDSGSSLRLKQPSLAADHSFNPLDELGAEAKAEVLHTFVIHAADDFSALERACAESNLTEVRFLAHRLRGSSLMVGANALAHACLPLEHAEEDAGVNEKQLESVRRAFSETLSDIDRDQHA
jgi:signal transduction histidine kinase/DNA-binding NarL/FixJ family response regulator